MKALVKIAGLSSLLLFAACQTTGGSSALLAGIPESQIKPEVVEAATEAAAGEVNSPELLLAASQIRASGANPVCGQFNMNSLAYMAGSGPVPGIGILKTIAVGAIAGVASGGISTLGIGSSFVENMVAGTANQVVFNTAKPVVDSIFPAADGTETIAEINAAADRVGCPHPTWLQDLSLKDSKKLLALLTAEFSTPDTIVDAVGG